MDSEVIKQEDGSFLNKDGQVCNEDGILLDDDGQMINEEGFLINALGQLLNEEGQAVNAEGQLINDKNELIDAEGNVITEDDDADGTMIPKRRYDSAARRARLAEEELKKTRAELQKLSRTGNTEGGVPSSVQDFDDKIAELDAKIAAAHKDGDVDAVVALNKELRTYERGRYQKIAEEAASTAGTKAEQKVALDNLITRLEEDYDAFNPDSDKYDQNVVNEVLELQKALMAAGNSPAQAMAKAVGYVIGEPEAAAKPASRKTNVDKNLSAANKQAPKMGDTGKDSSAGGDNGLSKSISDMSQSEFDALPEATKKRLRGDEYVPAA